MFHSAALKLTLWYLAIIMALSIVFSVVVYNFALNELERNTARQVYFFNDQLSQSDFLTFSRLRQRQLDEGRQRLQTNLVIFNLIVLVGGGATSYALARRTMWPIEDSLEAQTRFAGDASHELRTPLAVMQTQMEVALRDPKLDKKKAVELLESNLEEVAKLKSLSDGLLRLTSTDSLKSLKETVNLKTVAQQAVERWSLIAKTQKIDLHLETKPGVKAKGDHQSLVDLVSILIDNAIKYSSEGGFVHVKVLKKDKQALVQVSDVGQGIDAKELPRIFERFYRTDASRSKEQSGGYGLGLAIAQKIAEIHKGHIEVKSAPNKGSTFTVKLPLTS